MRSLPETQDALANLAANNQFGWGEHRHGNLVAGVNGLQVGSEEFDPMRHEPWQINPLDVMGLALGEYHVPVVLPYRPMAANVIIDMTRRQDHPLVAGAKRNLGVSLTNALEESLPGMTDQIHGYVIGDSVKELRAAGFEQIEPADEDANARTISEIAAEGLTLVLSDFRHLSFDPFSLGDVVAVKTNHPAERSIPAGVGLISLGGAASVNTNKPSQLAEVNARLQQEHVRITGMLRAAGASIAEVVAKPASPEGYGLAAADKSIAAALEEKHKQ
ncbi:MAG TPA: hypothetical protein VM124_03910 [Candidatus Limnocylindrales bacterium]|nr:hypothetical protein [Candidatus Limnocylindrales bacterium]